MEFSKLCFVPRARSAWEIFDLSCLLLRQWGSKLCLLWLSLVLPVAIVVALGLSVNWAVFLIWWLKPVFERPLLHYVSRAVFAQPVGLWSCIRVLFQLGLGQLIAMLTYRRFSPLRAYVAPLDQLEGLQGDARRQRQYVLTTRGEHRQTFWLLFCVHLELLLMVALYSVTLALIPQQELSWDRVWQYGNSAAMELSYLGVFLVSTTLVAPLFVIGGFCAYLNRRIELEGWDIELGFRRLAQRLGVGCLLLLCVGGGSVWAPPAYALTEAEVNRIQQQVDAIYASPVMTRTQTQWQLKAAPASVEEVESATSSARGEGWLALLNSLAQLGEGLARGVRLLLLLGITWLLYRGLQRWPTWHRKWKAGKKNAVIPDGGALPVLFGLNEQDGDADVEALAAWAEQALQEELDLQARRRVMACVLQISLLQAQQHYPIRLSKAMTEAECLLVLQQQLPPDVIPHYQQLFRLWRQLAWAHQPLRRSVIRAQLHYFMALPGYPIQSESAV